MYGYLRSRSALVVLLKRDPTDTFVSMKKLEAFGQPHTLEAINAEMHLMSEDSEFPRADFRKKRT